MPNGFSMGKILQMDPKIMKINEIYAKLGDDSLAQGANLIIPRKGGFGVGYFNPEMCHSWVPNDAISALKLILALIASGSPYLMHSEPH